MVEVGYRDDGVTLAMCGPVYVSIFRQPHRVEIIPHMQRTSRDLHARYGDNTVTISIVKPTATEPMSDELREKSATLAKETPRLAAAIVLEGEGFRAAMLRAAVSAIVLLARNPYPHKVFGVADDAIAWLRTLAKKANVELPADVGAVIASLDV